MPGVLRRGIELDADLSDRVTLHVAHNQLHSAEARPVSDGWCSGNHSAGGAAEVVIDHFDVSKAAASGYLDKLILSSLAFEIDLDCSWVDCRT
jgi:hypothetical protein